ncbi:thioredoxin TrxA [Paludibacterium yongneupense]|uniref:thioredoxin TrxA n=1 Tax=Paludibacterium yongneupense TaxID=400061 RepID=UPI0003FD307C|nr:thioredoxin TrxA [Paludibacterium yongneupense]
MSTAMKHVSDATFDAEVLQASGPVLVDYWAEWCGPCKMIAPLLEDLALSHADRLSVAKVDVDANAEVAGRYGIRGIPTLMLFKDGQVVATKVGALSKTQLAEFIDAHI